MRARILAVLAYTAAGLTLLVAAAVPFFLMGFFTNVVAHAGLHVDAAYVGGPVARTLDRNGYRILIGQPVYPHALQRIEPFVQIAFTPADKLPAQVSDEIDLDGDGQPDVRVSFALPAGARAPAQGNVVALNGKYQSFAGPGGGSFSRLMVRAGNQIVVRVPLNQEFAGR